MHGFELQLHLLPHFQVERSERFVKEQDLRLIDKGPRDRDSLLLAAGKRRNAPVLKAFQINE